MAGIFPSNALHGSTAIAGPGRTLSRKLAGAMHAAGVFLDVAFRVVVLGTDGARPPGPRTGEGTSTAPR